MLTLDQKKKIKQKALLEIKIIILIKSSNQ